MTPPLSLTLYGHPDSGHAYKVGLMLTVAGLPYNYHLIDINSPHETRPEPFRSLARYKEVPLLVMNNQPYVQSDAILCALAEATGRFGSENHDRMARAREWLFWEANRLGMSLPHLRYARKFSMESYNEGALTWLQARYDFDIKRLERELSDGRSFVLDDSPSIAEFSLCGYLFFADEAAVMVPPKVRAWLARISQLPGWRAPYDLMG